MGTPSPTKHSPPSYDGKSNWKSPTYAKTEKPTKYSPPKKGWKKPSYPKWKKTSKSTRQKNDHESYENEAVSHIYNPYDIRQRGIVKAQLEERIESDMQELAALNELES